MRNNKLNLVVSLMHREMELVTDDKIYANSLVNNARDKKKLLGTLMEKYEEDKKVNEVIDETPVPLPEPTLQIPITPRRSNKAKKIQTNLPGGGSASKKSPTDLKHPKAESKMKSSKSKSNFSSFNIGTNPDTLAANSESSNKKRRRSEKPVEDCDIVYGIKNFDNIGLGFGEKESNQDESEYSGKWRYIDESLSDSQQED